ncbi:MAG: hypothetical protein ACI9TA_003160 [Reinekea sp.]|jgi:hypothetical protein
MNKIIAVALAILASPAIAEGTRELDSHEHGVGELNIAFDGNTVAMELHAPGADIVGFEYAAESAEDRASIDAAVATLARPLDLFVMPAIAECSVVQASAGLENEEHDDKEHDADDEEHADEAGHTEFHAEYTLTCANPEALSKITFAYFNFFEHAREIEIQIISASGAEAFEVERDDPILDLRGMF